MSTPQLPPARLAKQAPEQMREPAPRAIPPGAPESLGQHPPLVVSPLVLVLFAEQHLTREQIDAAWDRENQKPLAAGEVRHGK